MYPLAARFPSVCRPAASCPYRSASSSTACLSPTVPVFIIPLNYLASCFIPSTATQAATVISTVPATAVLASTNPT